MQFWEANVQALLQFVTSVPGAATVLLLLAFAVIAFISEKMRWVALAFYFMILFVGPVPEVADGSTLNFQQLIQPFGAIRQYSRTIMSLMFLIVVPLTLMEGRPLMSRSAGSYLYLGLQLGWVFFQYMFGGPVIKILLGVGCFLLVWYVATGRQVRTMKEWYAAWRTIVWALLAFIGCHVLLLALHSPGMLGSNRLQGMTSNPQFTAQDLSLGGMILAALAADKEFRKALGLPLWIVWPAAGACVSLLGMTGSRGGAVFFATGLLVLFGARVFRALLFLVPAGAVAYLAGDFFYTENTSVGALNRIFDGQDSRSQLIIELYRQWMDSPILGNGGNISSGYNECLYMYVASRLGVFALMYVLLLIGVAVWTTMRGARAWRRHAGIATRLPMAIVIGMAIQNITEAGLLSQFTISTTLFLFSCELGVALRKLAPEPEAQAEAYEPYPTTAGLGFSA